MSFSDVSSVTSHFPTANEGFANTTSGSVSSGATIVGLNSTAGLTNGSVFVGVIEPGTVKEQVFTGIVDTGGTQITGVVWTKGTNIDHASGVSVVDYDTGTAFNMMRKGILVHSDQDGTLKAGAVDVAAVLANNVVETTKIKDANVTYAKLLTTIFSGQVTSYSTGGTFFYLNLGGIKLFWGQANVINIVTTGTGTGGVTLPAGFFSTIQTVHVTSQPGVDTRAYANVNQCTTTTLDIYAINTAGISSSATPFVFIIGT